MFTADYKNFQCTFVLNPLNGEEGSLSFGTKSNEDAPSIPSVTFSVSVSRSVKDEQIQKLIELLSRFNQEEKSQFLDTVSKRFIFRVLFDAALETGKKSNNHAVRTMALNIFEEQVARRRAINDRFQDALKSTLN
jgi:hypothetical protein